MKNKIRVASVNMTDVGSTGNIMISITNLANDEDFVAKAFSTHPFDLENKSVAFRQGIEYFGNRFENAIHTILGKITGYNGLFSFWGTFELIIKLKKFNPDIIHLHNLHKFCINLPMLFRYIKKKNIKVVWTLHDCWAFTGHCPHFTIAKCEKWKTECFACNQYNRYPKTYIDRSQAMFRLKKKWFSGVSNMVIVTPSNWLACLVNRSYLRDYPVITINNGIDLNIFKPTNSNFRQVYSCEDKKIILGVSFEWGYSKGLDVFIDLAKRLDKTYQVVLVGTNNDVDKELPSNIISIHRTYDAHELAGIYSAADLFINPTREDTYPTVNMEAIACGTPVLTFDVGGSAEIALHGNGYVVECDNVDAMESIIKKVCDTSGDESHEIIQKAKLFDRKKCFERYINLYNCIAKNGAGFISNEESCRL